MWLLHADLCEHNAHALAPRQSVQSLVHHVAHNAEGAQLSPQVLLLAAGETPLHVGERRGREPRQHVGVVLADHRDLEVVVTPDLAARWLQFARHELDQRRLASGVPALDGDAAASGHRELDVNQGRAACAWVRVGHVLQLQQGHALRQPQALAAGEAELEGQILALQQRRCRHHPVLPTTLVLRRGARAVAVLAGPEALAVL
mmetsp:Transcript_92623/g.239170  ORF Transcript_92623/g.239170 Transcript_92623/m.239170 type:complete len:203 (-) Transcript_92623:1149-1757(-)